MKHKLRILTLSILLSLLTVFPVVAQETAIKPYNQWGSMPLPKYTVTVSKGGSYNICLGGNQLRIIATGSSIPIYKDGKYWTRTDTSQSSTNSAYIRIGDTWPIGTATFQVGNPAQYTFTLNTRTHEKSGYVCKHCGTNLGAYTMPTYYFNSQSASVQNVLKQFGIGPGDYYHSGRDAWSYIYNYGYGKISSSDGEKYGSKYMPVVVKCGTKMADRQTDNNGDVYYSFDDYFYKSGEVTTWPIWSTQLTSMSGSPDGYAHAYYDISTSQIIVEHWYKNWSHNSSHHWKTCACGNAGSKAPHSSNTWRYDANNLGVLPFAKRFANSYKCST